MPFVPVALLTGILAVTSVAGTPRAVRATDEAPRPASHGAFEMNLYRPGVFVTEYTKRQCVAAAVQIMSNIVRGERDRGKARQRELYDLAVRFSRSPFPGTSEHGWARSLGELGAGPYQVRGSRTREGAVRLAVEALRRTGRPVGLLTWRGAHSFVMTGFRATADPALSGDFGIVGVYISDPWYPAVSTIWGPSRAPDSFYTLADLKVDYLPWVPLRRERRYEGRFVLVVPVEPRQIAEGARVRRGSCYLS